MKVVYYANDGVEFESESECLEYEKRLSIIMNELYTSVYAYDANGMVIEFDEEYLEDNFQDIAFIQFGSQNAIDMFTEKANDFGVCNNIAYDINRPVVVGERYFYNWDEDKWECLEDKRKELHKIARVFE